MRKRTDDSCAGSVSFSLGILPGKDWQARIGKRTSAKLQHALFAHTGIWRVCTEAIGASCSWFSRVDPFPTLISVNQTASVFIILAEHERTVNAPAELSPRGDLSLSVIGPLVWSST